MGTFGTVWGQLWPSQQKYIILKIRDIFSSLLTYTGMQTELARAGFFHQDLKRKYLQIDASGITGWFFLLVRPKK